MRYLAKSFSQRLNGLMIISCLFLAACGVNASHSVSQTSTPQILVNGLNISTSSSSLSITALHSGDGKIGWQHQAQWILPRFHVMSAPIIAAGVLYAPSDSYNSKTTSPPTGFLSAFRISDGQRLWQVKVGALGSPPIVQNGIVYLSATESLPNSTKKWMYALNAQSGKQIWRTELTGTGLNETFTFASGNLYISSNEVCFDMCTATNIFSLNAATGALRWHKIFQATSSSNITVDNNTAYVYIADGPFSTSVQGLYALNVDTGETLWFVAYAIPVIGSFSNPEQIPGATIQVIDGVIYAKTTMSVAQSPNPDYALTALDAHSGHALWSIPTTAVGTILAVDAHTFYVQTEKPNRDLTKPPTGSEKKTSASPYTYFLSAISMHNGQSLWQHQLVSAFRQSKVVDGTLYSEAFDPNLTKSTPLIATNTTNGDTIWQANIAISAISASSRGYSVFTIAQNVLYTVVNIDTLTAVSLEDGKILWQTKIPQTIIVAISFA